MPKLDRRVLVALAVGFVLILIALATGHTGPSS